jgi:3-hydroxymyristoyl/3-hydroxydecanoyl-(acyl carrier protein) dehydratase
VPKTRSEISKTLDIGTEFLFLNSFSYLSAEETAKTENQFEIEENILAQGFGTYEFKDSSLTRAHFLSNQVVPGSLLLESVLQCTAMTVYTHLEASNGLRALIIGASIELRNSLEIGEAIHIVSELEKIDRGIIRTSAICKTSEKIICKAQLKYWYPRTVVGK